ncbi:MAG: right-handed parallel beta-helix repeat-containing protein, partial [Bacteroidia bacterium]|nr:right-handed parallel beta-helix repeat-containing protein [Bacteroidia bacterium]
EISGITDDRSQSNIRTAYPKSGQLNGGGWAPDIGAVEYDGKPKELSGIKTVGTGKNYTTLAAAIAALNTIGVDSGGVTFMVDTGHTETFATPTAGLITATGAADRPVIFQKSGAGTNPVITAGAGTGYYDGIIVLNGSDYITFDGINVKENVSNNNSNTQMEFGYGILKASATNAPKHVTIKNCVIELNKNNGNTKGIGVLNHTPYSGVHLTINDSTGRTEDITLLNNSISNAKTGIETYGSSNTSYYNLRTIIAGNTITDFKKNGITTENENTLQIRGNTVKNTVSNYGELIGIKVNTIATTAQIEKNTVSGLTKSDYFPIELYGIQYISSTGTATIANNSIANLSAPNSEFNDAVVGVYIINGAAEVYYNTVNIHCTSGKPGFVSVALYTTTDYTITLRNNILINTSTYGKAVAYKRSNNTLSTYHASSNTNLFYAGTPDANHVLFSNGTDYQTLASYQALVAGRDSLSKTGAVTFISTHIDSAGFLQPDPSIRSVVESGGQEISGITDDRSQSNIRTAYPKIGQLNGGGWAPDIGAVEYDGKPFMLSDTITVGTGKDYTTLAAAIADLNKYGVDSGGVTFMVDTGHTETFATPTAGLITATGAADRPVIFQKSGAGTNPVITAGAGTGYYDGIIVLNGSDYITFDGINVKENVSNNNSNTQMEFGYGILKASATNAPKHVTIKNCVIELNKNNGNTKGIGVLNHTPYSGVHLTINDSTGRTEDITLLNNSISNAKTGIETYGSSNTSYYNLRTIIAGNTITDFKKNGITTENENTLQIRGNTVKNTVSNYGELIGIKVNTIATTAQIEKNTVSGLTKSDYFPIELYGIQYISSTGTATIANNSIANLSAPNSEFNDAVVGVYIINGAAEVYYNTVNIHCTSGKPGFVSVALYTTTDYTITLRNNILINTSTYGKAVAYKRSNNTLSTYHASSNTNLFYAGTPDANHVLFSNGTDYQTLASYQALVAGRDSLSKTGAVTFISTHIDSAGFLQPDPSIRSVVESGGQEISGITDDRSQSNIRTA